MRLRVEKPMEAHSIAPHRALTRYALACIYSPLQALICGVPVRTRFGSFTNPHRPPHHHGLRPIHPSTSPPRIRRKTYSDLPLPAFSASLMVAASV